MLRKLLKLLLTRDDSAKLAFLEYLIMRQRYLDLGELPSNNEFLVKIIKAYFAETKSIFVFFKLIYNFIEFIEDAIIICLKTKSIRFLFLKLGAAALDKKPQLAAFYFYIADFRFSTWITALGSLVFGIVCVLLQTSYQHACELNPFIAPDIWFIGALFVLILPTSVIVEQLYKVLEAYTAKDFNVYNERFQADLGILINAITTTILAWLVLATNTHAYIYMYFIDICEYLLEDELFIVFIRALKIVAWYIFNLWRKPNDDYLEVYYAIYKLLRLAKRRGAVWLLVTCLLLLIILIKVCLKLILFWPILVMCIIWSLFS